MEGFLVIGFIALLIYVFYQHNSKTNLKDEVDRLADVLEITLTDSDRALEDHRSAERELAIVNAKLSVLKETTLTPENSVLRTEYQSKVFELAQGLSQSELDLDCMTKKFEESRGKQISERVRLGQVGENFAAFHDQFPYERKNVKALFQPIDLIYFGEDEIVFIDVKTGNAKLSTKQRRIRDTIQAGRVRFETHTLNEDGYKIK